MKIWKEFGSSHSGNVSVVGIFTEKKYASDAFEMIKDFTLGEWEERHESFDEFLKTWSDRFHPDLKYSSINATDYSLGIDNAPNIEIIENQIKITRIRSDNVGGIVKLMLFAGAKKTDVTNNQL